MLRYNLPQRMSSSLSLECYGKKCIMYWIVNVVFNRNVCKSIFYGEHSQ